MCLCSTLQPHRASLSTPLLSFCEIPSVWASSKHLQCCALDQEWDAFFSLRTAFPSEQLSRAHLPVMGMARGKGGWSCGCKIYLCKVGKFLHALNLPPDFLVFSIQASKMHYKSSRPYSIQTKTHKEGVKLGRVVWGCETQRAALNPWAWGSHPHLNLPYLWRLSM